MVTALVAHYTKSLRCQVLTIVNNCAYGKDWYWRLSLSFRCRPTTSLTTPTDGLCEPRTTVLWLNSNTQWLLPMENPSF